jgi:hypothetical protein
MCACHALVPLSLGVLLPYLAGVVVEGVAAAAGLLTVLARRLAARLENAWSAWFS